MTMSELYGDDPSRWCQGEAARDKDGNQAFSLSSEAQSWCLFGAMVKCYGYTNHTIAERIYDAVKPHTMATYNDSPERTFDDIVKLCKELNV